MSGLQHVPAEENHAALLYRNTEGSAVEVALPPTGALLGRAPECLVRTDDPCVSRRNCQIIYREGQWVVEDLGSANGTYVNERRVQIALVRHGDVIRCGSLQVRFVLHGEEWSTLRTLAPAVGYAEVRAMGRGPTSTMMGGGEPRSPHNNVGPVDDAFHRLDIGWLGVDAPDTTGVGAPVKMTVLATRSHLQELLLKLTEHPDPIFKQARLGELLRVELKPERPEDFLIERLSPAEQAVLDDEATTWEWIVTARRPGDRQRLRVLVSNLVDVAGRLIEKGLPSQTILLDVTLTVVGPGQPFGGPALRCFGCYAPMDQPYWDALATHLALLCRQGVLSLVHERSVAPGAVFSAEQERLLAEADLVLLLVSADFLSSDLCYQDQLRLALERHGRGLAAILPILVRAADCRGAAFGHLPLSPNNGRPITLWPDRDEAWAQVATEIRAQAERLVFQRRAGKTRAGAA